MYLMNANWVLKGGIGWLCPPPTNFISAIIQLPPHFPLNKKEDTDSDVLSAVNKADIRVP